MFWYWTVVSFLYRAFFSSAVAVLSSFHSLLSPFTVILKHKKRRC
nr:MAG TPA: hypothetical protein [Caudoviricetes sp.]